MRVVDADGNRLPHDGRSVGELVVRTPSLFSGYWERPELTNELLRDGWFATGDAGRIDAQGYVHVEGALADRISVAGDAINTTRIERVIERVPGVAECAAFGSDGPGGDQVVSAAVVLWPGADTSLMDITWAGAPKLPAALRPQRVWFLDALPRSHSGQIMRHRLKAEVLREALLSPSFSGGAIYYG
jgi:acyl-coenzyme A synthetase/AMP-(fatty) acid ligase